MKVSGALCALSALLAALPAVAEPIVGLADSAALRATVLGTPPQEIAPLPARVPLNEIDITLPWARQPRPAVFWFAKQLRAWVSPQRGPAPLAIVISGTGADGNTEKLSLLRAVLYGAGYHVLTMPSPTFPGFIAAASSTGVAGDLLQDSHDLYAAVGEILGHLPARIRITEIDILGYSLGGGKRCSHQVHRFHGAAAQTAHSPCGHDQSAGEPVQLHESSRPAVHGKHRARRSGF